MTPRDDELDRRLRDLFESIDAQLVAPPLRATPRSARRVVGLAVAVTVAVLLAGAAALLLARPDGVEVHTATTPPAVLGPGAFDRLADEMCTTLDRARNGVAPRFQTAEAYLVVAESRREAVDGFIASLLGTAPPADRPALPTTVVADLGRALAALRDVEDAAQRGDLDRAGARWATIDDLVDDALVPLHDHGATRCG